MATAFLNLQRNEALKRLGSLPELAILFLGGLLFGYALILVRPWHAIGGALLGVILVTVAALLLVFGRHVWFSWTLPAAVQIPAALSWSLFVSFRQKRQEQSAPAIVPAQPADAAAPTIVAVEGISRCCCRLGNCRRVRRPARHHPPALSQY